MKLIRIQAANKRVENNIGSIENGTFALSNGDGNGPLATNVFGFFVFFCSGEGNVYAHFVWSINLLRTQKQTDRVNCLRSMRNQQLALPHFCHSKTCFKFLFCYQFYYACFNSLNKIYKFQVFRNSRNHLTQTFDLD